MPDTELKGKIASYPIVVEQETQQSVRCEIRDGRVFFVFGTNARPDLTNVVDADMYLATLKDLRNDPIPAGWVRHQGFKFEPSGA